MTTRHDLAWLRPSWLQAALLGLYLLSFLGGYWVAASHQPAATAATLAPGPPGARYQVATQAGYGWACLVEWDATTGQVWLYDRERREWTALPALPAERSDP